MVPADVDVKTLILRPMPFTTQMPFAGEESLVPMLLQLLGNRHLLVREVVAILRMQQLVGRAIALPGDPVGDIHPHWMPSGHDTRARGTANRTSRVALCKPHAGGRKFIDVWSFMKLAPVGADIRPAHIIDEEEQKVGVLGSVQFGETANNAQK